jgi:hypothetical protein
MNRKSMTRTALALAACMLLTAPLHAATTPNNLGYGLDKLVESNEAIKSNPELSKLHNGFTTEAAADYAALAITDPSGDRLTVDILLTGKLSVGKMKSLLASKLPSLTVLAAEENYRSTGIIEAYVSIDEVPALANLPGVRSVFLALRPDNDGGSGGGSPNVVPGDVLNRLGTTFDQGVTQHRVDRINQFYNPNALVNYNGSGVSVAVISDSFNTRVADVNNPSAATDIAGFDLPGDPANPVNTQPLLVYHELAGVGTDEGRGMAQIVYKMAPKAKLAFATGAIGEVQFAADVRAMAAGVVIGATPFKADVIADDLSYGGESFYGETIIGNAIDDVAADGVSYFSSAGNNVGINAYESALRIVPDASAGGTKLTAAAGNTALAGTNINLATVPYNLYAGGFHNFNPAAGQLDVAQLVNMPGTTTASTEMQWDDPYDQKPLEPATPPIFSSGGTISVVGGSVTFDASSAPALPTFTAGTRYSIQEVGTSGGFDGVISIYNNADVLVFGPQDTFIDENVIFVAPSTGQFKIKVEGCCGSTGDFTIDVSVPLYANSGTSAAGSTVTFDASSTPALPTFTAGTPYTIQETATGGDFDGIVSILDPSDNVIVSQDTGTDETVTFYAPVSGQYKIKVAPFAPSAGTFNLTITQSLGTAGVTTDLNLLAFRADNGAYISTRSLTSNNLANNRPVELGIVRSAGFTQMQFVIARANTPVAPQLPTRVRWSTRGNGAGGIGPAEYFTYNATTTKGHATAKGCNGTAAYGVFRANLPESFTSPGPATILFDKDANRLAVPEIRQSPVIAAADAANTSSFGGDTVSDPDTKPNFSGTSAAAPHAAAIAALVLQAHGGPGTVTPAAMRTLLQGSVFPHDLDPSASSGSAMTTDGGTISINILSDNDTNTATGLNDPNSIVVSYSGPGSLQSLTFNPQGTPATAGRPTGGSNGVQDAAPGTVTYFENNGPGLMFRPASKAFTLGTLTGLSPGDISAPQFANPAPAPAAAGDSWTMSVGFPTGQFGDGKVMRFTVGRGGLRSSDVTTPGGQVTLSPIADLFGGGVMLPSGITIAEGMTFSGTTTAGGTFSGTIKNQIGFGYTVVDGYGFIDASVATGAALPQLVATGASNPGSAGVGSSTLLTVTVTPGAAPASTGIYVAADLTSLGGGPAQRFYDDGTSGDVVAGDNVFSLQTVVGASATLGGKSLPVVVSDAQGRGGSTVINFNVSAFTPPTGTGLATPSSVGVNEHTLLTVQTTPGTYPASTGIAVTANLSSIGGSATQQFFDDGTNGDVTAGDGKFSFDAVVALATAPGAKNLTATISDAQLRSSNANISLNVLGALSGVGLAFPNSVALGGNATLIVSVVPGTNPASTGLTVSVDLSAIGGSATQTFYDDGTNGDQTAGDNVFTYALAIPANATIGTNLLPAVIGDDQSRSANATIQIDVTTDGVIFKDGFE